MSARSDRVAAGAGRPGPAGAGAGTAGLVLGVTLYAAFVSAPQNTSAREIAAVHAPALGVAVTPENFPAHTAQDVDEAFALARDIGDYAVFIYQWGELDTDIARALVEQSRRAGLTPILGLSPTTLDQGRKELELGLQGKRGRRA